MLENKKTIKQYKKVTPIERQMTMELVFYDTRILFKFQRLLFIMAKSG